MGPQQQQQQGNMGYHPPLALGEPLNTKTV